MTALILSYRRPAPMPLRRAAMPAGPAPAISRPGYRVFPVNIAGLPPHYHIVLDAPFAYRAPEGGMQEMLELKPRGILPCEDAGCTWYLLGHEGESDGKPFRHPQGVRCGDEAGCIDDNCPCPDNVVEWPENLGCAGHIRPCHFCDGSYRHLITNVIRPVGESEYVDRLGEGVHALHQILTRGL